MVAEITLGPGNVPPSFLTPAPGGVYFVGTDAVVRMADDPMILKLKNEASDLLAQRARLSQLYREKHPDLVVLDAQIKLANQRMQSELTKMLQALETQVRVLRGREEALLAFQERMNDPNVDELVFAINKGEELGTPLSRILRDQAAQMQVKRAQWGEMAAADAEVKIIFPGILTMVACLLVIVATFVLPALTAM